MLPILPNIFSVSHNSPQVPTVIPIQSNKPPPSKLQVPPLTCHRSTPALPSVPPRPSAAPTPASRRPERARRRNNSRPRTSHPRSRRRRHRNPTRRRCTRPARSPRERTSRRSTTSTTAGAPDTRIPVRLVTLLIQVHRRLHRRCLGLIHPKRNPLKQPILHAIPKQRVLHHRIHPLGSRLLRHHAVGRIRRQRLRVARIRLHLFDSRDQALGGQGNCGEIRGLYL